MQISSFFIDKGIKTLSSIDNPSSLIPLGIKDGVTVAGRTIMANQEGGRHEGREKLIEELGTSVLWLGGIPACRTIIDKTAFKLLNLDPSISIKKITCKDDQKFKGGLSSIGNFIKSNATSMAEISQVDPCGNMIPMDIGISLNRVTFVSRNNQEKIERVINESGMLFFFFFAQGFIQKAFDKISNKFGIPTELDFKILCSKKFKEKMEKVANDPKAREELIKKLKEYRLDENESAKSLKKKLKDENTYIELQNKVYKSIKNNFVKKDDILMYFAKVTGLIKTLKNEAKLKNDNINLEKIKDTKGNYLDTRKYIEIEDISKLSENLEKYIEKMGKTPARMIKKSFLAKSGILVANIGICISALAYILPKIQYTVREKFFGSKEFPGIRGYKEEAKKKS